MNCLKISIFLENILDKSKEYILKSIDNSYFNGINTVNVYFQCQWIFCYKWKILLISVMFPFCYYFN